MRSSFAVTHGLPLSKSPNLRQQAGRRRLAVVCTMAGLALASGLIGALSTHSPDASQAPSASVSSNFPSE